MKALLMLALVLPAAAEAQLVMYAVTGGTQTPVTSGFPMGASAVGTALTTQFEIKNTGSTNVSMLLSLGSSPEFRLTVDGLSPWTLASGATLGFSVAFTPDSAGSINTVLQVTSTQSQVLLSVVLQGNGVDVPTLTASAGCSGAGAISFGSVQVGQTGVCALLIVNPFPGAIVISAPPQVVGEGFVGLTGLTAQTIAPGQPISFRINFTPPSLGIFSGALILEIVAPTLTSPFTQSFPLTGVGSPPPLPTPSLTFDSGAPASAQQRVLTMTIPGGSPIAATGYVNLTFTPSTASVKDDSEIVFLANGARTIPFSVAAGATTALLNGQSSATFQTGTTEGTITFTITTAAAMTGDPTATFVIPGAKVMIDSTSASMEDTGYLNITIIGADNTYSAGQMSFSFFDTSGNAIFGVQSADFTSAFKTYYGGDTAGSAFQVLVSFPVTGSVANIGSVTVTLTNSAGIASTGSLTFQ